MSGSIDALYSQNILELTQAPPKKGLIDRPELHTFRAMNYQDIEKVDESHHLAPSLMSLLKQTQMLIAAYPSSVATSA